MDASYGGEYHLWMPHIEENTTDGCLIWRRIPLMDASYGGEYH